MSDFVFTHSDGREGKRWSCWAAIAAAVGPGEARNLPEMEDPVWQYGEDGRRADVNLSESGEKIGVLFQGRE